ncbi:MAG TPA: ABC transporter permease [Candidatus Acidoferrum sp.]|nr:ABC transporter permease [Candidatus Acidoferrum sp.]
MQWLRILGSRLRGLLRKERGDSELDAELGAHLDALTEENIRRGMNEQEARYAARREFGGLEQTKESYREQRGLPFFETLAQDLRYASRMLLKSPGFTSAIILTLALGIGANTALFSLVNAVLLGNLPVRHPEELVVIKYTDSRSQEAEDDFSYPMYQAIRDKNTVFTSVLTRAAVDFNASYGAQSERAVGELVSGNYFETLRVQPFLGRLIGPEDDSTPSANPVAVLSYGYWQRRFGSDPGIVGEDVILNNHSIHVIGVTPPQFYGTEMARNPDIRVPMMMTTVFRPVPANRMQSARHRWITVLARRKPDVTLAQAQASLDILYHQVLAAELQELGSSINAHNKERALASRIQLAPGSQGFAHLRGEMERPLLLMFSITGIVLLVACANLTNLLLARNAKRKQEIYVRLAIGAGRGRLIRQWLTESLLLAVLGGCAGVIVAYWAKTGMLGFLPASYSANLHAPMDLRVLGFALLASLVTGLLFGLAPALQLSHTGVSSALRNDAPSIASGERLLSLRSALIFLQVALSLPLLIGAGLFLHSLRNLRGVNTGFLKENVFLATLNPSMNGYPQQRIKSLYDDLLARVRALPRVRAASLTTSSVISGSWDQEGVKVEGYRPGPDENMSPNAAIISPGYFATLGIPFVEGRDLTEQDTSSAPKVVIINETMAHYFFGSKDALGKKIGTSDDPKVPPEMEIIGVVKDAKYVRLSEKPRRHFYTAMAQEPRLFDMTLQVRTAGDPEKIGDLVRAQVHDLDANLPLYATTTLEIQIDNSLTQERLLTWLSSLFGLLATLLASLGLSGVVAFSVARRTREIGIRMALGAQPRAILRHVVSHMAFLVTAGMAVGLAAAFGLSRLLGSMLFEVGSADPLAYAGACFLLGVVAALAAYLPAQRATLVDPVVALRYE